MVINMKKIIAFIITLSVALTLGFFVLADEAKSADDASYGEEEFYEETENPEETEEIPSEDSEGKNEKTTEFAALMEELYGYFLEYTVTEGDNAFEKAVNFAWRYKGDVGGISAAIATVVLIAILIFKWIPSLKNYAAFTNAATLQTKNEMLDTLSSELEKYAPSLEVVQTVAEIYPQFAACIEKLMSEDQRLCELVTQLRERVDEFEGKHARAMALQGATFKDIISLSALPASKKSEILENYRVIELSDANAEIDNDDGETSVGKA